MVYRRHLVIGTLPLHALLAPVALVCFAGALLADIAYAASAQVQWSNFAAWLLAFGTLFAFLELTVALVDFYALPARPRPASGHVWLALGVAALVAALLDDFVHTRDGWTAVVPDGLVLSAITLLLALATAIAGHLLWSAPAWRTVHAGELR